MKRSKTVEKGNDKKQKKSRQRLQQESQFFYSLQIHIILGTIFLQFPNTHFLQFQMQNIFFNFPAPP